MRVLFLLTYYHPHWTGLTQYAKSLAKLYSSQGVEVTVITTQHDRSLPRNEIVEGVNVIRYPTWFQLSRSQISPPLILNIWRELKNYDYVFVFLPMAEVLWISWWTKVWKHRLYLVYNGDLILPRGKVLNRILEYIYKLTTQTSIRMSDGVIVNTEDYARNSPVLKQFKSKWINIVPPLEKIESGKKDLERLRGMIGRNKKVVGFAGRFVEEKGFDILLLSIARVAKKFPEVKFVFAGETNINYETFFQKNQEMISKSRAYLTLIGKLGRHEMGSFYKICDVLVISSRSDFFPFVQAEALLNHTPVVVTDIPGARWLVKRSGAGEVVVPEDYISLADGIIKAIENRKNYKSKFKKVEEIFNRKHLIKKYMNLLSSND